MWQNWMRTGLGLGRSGFSFALDRRRSGFGGVPLDTNTALDRRSGFSVALDRRGILNISISLLIS
jgi:hypothetical protein